MVELIVIDDDGDDEVQCLGGTPRRTTRTPFHNRTTSSASADSSPSSNGSATSSSSKKRKTKQVNDGSMLNHTDWQFEDGMRSPFDHNSRSRESTMSLGDAPSPRSTGSNSPNSPTRAPATPAKSYILIDSSTDTASGTGNTAMTFGTSTRNIPNKTTAQGDAHEAPFGSAFDLPPRKGSNASNQSRASLTSSGLSDPPQSRGVSFDTFQASLAPGRRASPPRIGTLSLQETLRQVTEIDDNEASIDPTDNNDEGDDEIQITGVTSSGWGREDSPLGSPSAFQGHLGAQATQSQENTNPQSRLSKSPPPPKRKRSVAFSDDDDEGEDGSASGSHYSPAQSSRGSSRSGSAPRGIPDMEPVVITDDGEDEELFVDAGDDTELPEDEDGTGDDSDLPEISGLAEFGRKTRPIDIDTEKIEEAYIENNGEVLFMGSKPLKQVPRPSVAAAFRRRSSLIPRRNPEIVYPLKDLESITHRTWEFKRGTFMEVLDLDGTDTTYLLIAHIIQHEHTGEIKIRGHQFMRARAVFGMLDRTQNEMCRMLEVDEDDDRPWMEQAMIEVGLDACIFKPRKINITNRSFGREGACTFRAMIGRGRFGKTKKEIEDRYLLACRWECIRFWPTAKNRTYQDLRGCRPKILRMLKADDPQLMGHSVRQDDDLIRDEWRGKGATVLGGSYIPGGELLPQGFFRLEDGEMHKVHVDYDADRRNEGFTRIESTFNMDLTVDDEVALPKPDGAAIGQRHFSAHLTQTIDLTDPTLIPPFGSIRSSVSSSGSSARGRVSPIGNHIRGSIPLQRRPGQKYTYGDAFCGAGGATRGAHMAGLKVLWGFDMDTHACSSWHRNFPSAALYEMDAQSICSDPSINFRCDILHMSPPCQYFSPAHTIAGKGDEANIAALFAVEQILKTARPRLATLEQTFGITNPGFSLFFQRLVNMFTTLEYSVTYKICQMANWGLPQRRVRLIIIAAGPGEKLPEMPKDTHSDHSSVAGNLRPWARVADIIDSIPADAPDHNLSSSYLTVPRKRWNGDSICPRAMTCAGGQNYHYDGRRMLTNREFAAIQGFPMEHVFGNRNVKRQIGNAVPPCIAKILFDQCRKALEEADGVPKEVVVLDDD